MAKNLASILVSVVDKAAVIKVTGRANFTYSVPFKTLVQELRQRGTRGFMIDLSECTTMDSTFLGVLAGLARETPDGGGPPNACFQLFNPTPRVADLLENLGIAHLFQIVYSEAPRAETVFVSGDTTGEAPSKEQITQICLEAHETLMEINPDNIPKFKDVTQFLAEDLKRVKEEGAKG